MVAIRKALAVTGLAVALAVSAAACAPTGLSAQEKTAVIHDVGEFLEGWTSAGRDGRYEALKPMYSNQSGFAWIEQGRIAYASAGAVADGLDQAAAMGARVNTRFSEVEITPLAPDAAAVHARYDFALQISPTQLIQNQGVFTAVVVKEGERWVFLQGAFNEEPPPPPPAPAYPPAPLYAP